MIDRTQKKCFIAATACHGLLICVLLFGAALMPSREEHPMTMIHMYSSAAISDALSSGGDPNANVPVAQPPAAQPEKPVAQPDKTEAQPIKPVVQPEKIPLPPVKREPIALPKPEPVKVPIDKPKPHIDPPKLTKLKPKPEPKEDPTPTPKTPKVILDPASLKMATRKPSDAAKVAQEAADARARADAKRRADQFTEISKRIGKDIAKDLVDTSATPGVGGLGELSVNYRDIIASKYYNAWTAPPDLDDATTPVVLASVTIDRDGSVVTARITKGSGNAKMDRSIANVLETVTFIEPFPASFKEQQRTVTIKFNLQAKRQTG